LVRASASSHDGARDPGLDRLGQVAGADAGQEDDDVEVAGDQARGEGQGLGVLAQGDLAEGGGLHRLAAVLGDQAGHRPGHAALERRHAAAGQG
jgi:hypothetical protein